MRLCYLAACINVCGGEFPDLLNLPHVLEITDHWIDSKSGGGELSCSCLVLFIRFGSFSSCLRLLVQDCRNVLRGGDGGWLTFVLTIFEIAARTERIQYPHYFSLSSAQFVVSVQVKMKALLICTKRTNTWTHSRVNASNTSNYAGATVTKQTHSKHRWLTISGGLLWRNGQLNWAVHLSLILNAITGLLVWYSKSSIVKGAHYLDIN